MKIRVILILLPFTFQLIKAQNPGIKDQSTYFLSSIFIGGQKNTIAKDRGHIVFNTKVKNATCFTSCNFIQLKYTQKDGSLKFTSISQPKEACPDHLIGLESDFKENLPKVTNYLAKDKKLIFFNKKDTLMIFYLKDEVKK